MVRRSAIGAGVATVLFASAASANPGISGYSGKPYFGMAQTCDSTCHEATSPAPKLTLTIPTTVQAGSTNDVTLVVEGTREATSFDAAFSDGVKVIKGTNTEIPFPVETPEEVVAKTPVPAGASATYAFSFVAPKSNGPITLWVAGMSASGKGTGGDGVAKTTRTITVVGGAAPADGGAGDAGTSSSASSSSSSGGVEEDEDASTSASSGGASSGGSGARLPSRGDDGGCAVWRGGSSRASIGLFAIALFALGRRIKGRRSGPRSTRR